MSRITKRPEAEADLLEIALYIAQDDIRASDRFIDAVVEKLELLARHPAMGRLRPELATNVEAFPSVSTWCSIGPCAAASRSSAS